MEILRIGQTQSKSTASFGKYEQAKGAISRPKKGLSYILTILFKFDCDIPPGGPIPDALGAPCGCCGAVMLGATPLVFARGGPEVAAPADCGPDIMNEMLDRLWGLSYIRKSAIPWSRPERKTR